MSTTNCAPVLAQLDFFIFFLPQQLLGKIISFKYLNLKIYIG
jgi:hypothetical protein